MSVAGPAVRNDVRLIRGIGWNGVVWSDSARLPYAWMTNPVLPSALVWHRTDLRLADNVAVTGAAVAATGSVAGVIVLPVGPHEQLLLSRRGGKTGHQC